MEVLSEIQQFNPKYSKLYDDQNRMSIGTCLQSNNHGKFPDYHQIGKGINSWVPTSQGTLLQKRHSKKLSTGEFYAHEELQPRKPVFRASTGALCTGSKEKVTTNPNYRASTGTLPRTKKPSYRTLQSGHRLLTCEENGINRQSSYQHILARDLQSTDPITEHTYLDDDEVAPENYCGRCCTPICSQYFECNDCPNFKLCAECGDGGIYCLDDTHSWVEKGSRYVGSCNSQIIGNISAGEARTLYYGTRTFPSIFRPPSPVDTPETLFIEDHRFIRKTNPREILLYADGACIQGPKSDPVAGWAFVYRPSAYTQDGTLTHAGTISGRLEKKGPTGMSYIATGNRAELRAVIAALQFLDWSKDCNRGWRSVVIATDSEYVTCSVTKWISDWEDSQWKLEDKKTDVNNKDLWKLLLSEVRRYHSEGVKIAFWRVPRHCNKRSYEFAKKATGRGYKERPETVIFQPDGPVKVRVCPFSPS